MTLPAYLQNRNFFDATLVDIADWLLWCEGTYRHAADLFCWISMREALSDKACMTWAHQIADVVRDMGKTGIIMRGAKPELWHHMALTRFAFPGGEQNHKASLNGDNSGGDAFLYAWSAPWGGDAVKWAIEHLIETRQLVVDEIQEVNLVNKRFLKRKAEFNRYRESRGIPRHQWRVGY